MKEFGGFEGCREGLAGVGWDGEKEICCGPVLFECELAAGGDPEGFGVVGELGEDLVCGVEGFGVAALAELLFGEIAEGGDIGVLREQ
jgi:hypothetical protein